MLPVTVVPLSACEDKDKDEDKSNMQTKTKRKTKEKAKARTKDKSKVSRTWLEAFRENRLWSLIALSSRLVLS